MNEQLGWKYAKYVAFARISWLSSVAQRSSNLMIRMPHIFYSLTKKIDRSRIQFSLVSQRWEQKKKHRDDDWLFFVHFVPPILNGRPANHDRFFFSITMKMWWAFSYVYLYMLYEKFRVQIVCHISGGEMFAFLPLLKLKMNRVHGYVDLWS